MALCFCSVMFYLNGFEFWRQSLQSGTVYIHTVIRIRTPNYNKAYLWPRTS